MKVVDVTRFGGPEVLVESDAPDPIAGAGQVVIDVSVADVLFLDIQIRSGRVRDYFPQIPPYVPGNGVAGLVLSVGEGVDPGLIGRRVVAHTGQRGGSGGYAERAVVAAEELVSVPEELGLREAAALLHDGVTALGLAESAQIRAGEWVLVVGAGGGLGILLVQLAHAAGALVVGAARGRRKLDQIVELGADAVVDYSQPDWVDQVLEATGGSLVDVVFDGVGGPLGQAAFAITARDGRFSAHGAASGRFAAIDPLEAKRRGVVVRGIEQVQSTPAEQRRLTERALSEAAAGRITPVIGQTFPLVNAAGAHTAMEARSVIGKTLLLV